MITVCSYRYPGGLVLRLIAVRRQFGLKVSAFVSGRRLPFTVSMEDAELLGPLAVYQLFDIARCEFELLRSRDRIGAVTLA